MRIYFKSNKLSKFATQTVNNALFTDEHFDSVLGYDYCISVVDCSGLLHCDSQVCIINCAVWGTMHGKTVYYTTVYWMCSAVNGIINSEVWANYLSTQGGKRNILAVKWGDPNKWVSLPVPQSKVDTSNVGEVKLWRREFILEAHEFIDLSDRWYLIWQTNSWLLLSHFFHS